MSLAVDFEADRRGRLFEEVACVEADNAAMTCDSYQGVIESDRR